MSRYPPRSYTHDVEHRGVVELIGRLGQVFATMHAFHHGGVLACAGDDFVFGGAGAEPPVALQAEAGAEGAGFVFDATLNEEMVSEDLGDSTVPLEEFSAFSGFLGETVEEIESGSIWIHRV